MNWYLSFIFCKEDYLLMNNKPLAEAGWGLGKQSWVAHPKAIILGGIYLWVLQLKWMRMYKDIYVGILWIQRRVVTYPSLEACNNWLNWTFATSGLYSWSLCSRFCPGWPRWTWTTSQGPSQSWFLWFSDTWNIHCSHWSDGFSASLKNQSQHMLSYSSRINQHSCKRG